ncbi:MAG TPA: GntG family PLP-dependent aldolase, partial [Actinomycetota bacterium]|nr:GntG family PLP-dependent aldolase [Actinomycetota bacterium]
TMANQIALRLFCRPGHEVVAEAGSHIATVESHAAASLSGVTTRAVHGDRGLIPLAEVEAALRSDPYRVRVVDLVAVENTHQAGGGRVLSVDGLGAIAAAARGATVPIYLDGARIFNAAAASQTSVRAFASHVDALMFSVSKGLGAPVGSLLCGSRAMIEEARRVKLQLGGGWRQAGVLAAAAIVALEMGPGRLGEDHANARRLAEGVEEAFPGSVWRPETNIVFVDPGMVGGEAPEVARRLAEEGVLASIVGGRVRMVTHLDVDAEDVEKAIAAWRRLAR